MARIEFESLTLQGGDGDDDLTGTWDQDTLLGNGGDDVLRGEGGSDRLYGGDGDDQLFGGNDNDYLDGGAGDDLSYGGEGDDLLTDPDGGNDSLWGEGGNDRLTIERHRSIGESLYLSGGAGHDIIRVSVTHPDPFSETTTATVDGGSGDDVVWIRNRVSSVVDLGDGNDRLIVDVIESHTVTLGAGNDVVELGGSGFGTITITDFATGEFGDQLNLGRSLGMYGIQYDPEVNPFHSGAAALRQVGADVQVLFDGRLVFILKNVQTSALTPTNFAGADPAGGPGFPGANFFGGAQGEQIWGSRGDDRIEGMGGDDTLFGGHGDDVILGGPGNDVLDGGPGDDVLYGGDGNDTFEGSGVAGAPGGNDVYYGEGGNDSFVIGRAAEDPGSVTVWGGDGDDYVSSDTVRDLIVDGGDGNDSVRVSNVDRWTVNGGAGDDAVALAYAYRNSTLFFGVGTFDGGAGHDTVWLDEHSRFLDIVGIDANSFRVGDAVMRNVEGLYLGGLDSHLDLSLMTHGLTVFADNGMDVLIGSAFDDILRGGVGDDQLDGAGGFDTAVFEQAFRFYEIVTEGDVTTVRNIGEAADVQGTDTLRNIERLQFEDGWYTLDGTYIPAVIEGTAGADELRGYAWSDSLYGGAGDDVIHASGGNDFIDGGAGNDLLEVGNIRAHYTILNVGDDFLLKGPMGATAFLTGIETLRFLDGTVVELNRMYDQTPPALDDDAKADEPLVLPGIGEPHDPAGWTLEPDPPLVMPDLTLNTDVPLPWGSTGYWAARPQWLLDNGATGSLWFHSDWALY